MYAHVHGDNGMCCYLPTVLYLERYQAHRALELLEDYHAKLTRPQDKQLRLAIERVIRIFKSRLFQALLDENSSEILTEALYERRRKREKKREGGQYRALFLLQSGIEDSCEHRGRDFHRIL
ncbi:uncharacterized protein LOC116414207 [Apis florea]|uniref:uncharacterized protein LOC116414207 n=1 Tax=Apis florea TaxID=7463 RepID=UPI0012FF4662|nr:uncharacterized protein LOC116414207 [Apis florea]